MLAAHHEIPGPRRSSRTAWLDRPLSQFACVLGWLGATAIFVTLTQLLGGPTTGDSEVSTYSAFAIAHGDLSCAFLPTRTLAAPLYPLLTGALAALTRLGAGVPFPSRAQLGAHCQFAFIAVNRWASESHALLQVVHFGYFGWLALMAGAIALLRTTNRGRHGWELATLAFLACVPVVFMSVLEFFHPQDLLAVGLALGCLACARRGSWAWAGLLGGLAVTSQQLGLLVIAPLLLLAPTERRLKFAGWAVGAMAIIDLPLLLISSGRAARSITIGTGFGRSIGGTLLWETGLHGAPLFIVSRLVPLALAMALARTLRQRLGTSVLEPVPLLAIIAVSLGLRLVFEMNLWGYYFMPLAATLLLLDVSLGRLRGTTWSWLGLVAMAFNPVNYSGLATHVTFGLELYRLIPLLFTVAAVAVVIAEVLRRRIHWYLVAWIIFVGVATLRGDWYHSLSHQPFPTWLWQVVLVSGALVLAARPLLAYVRGHPSPGSASEESGSLDPSLTLSR